MDEINCYQMLIHVLEERRFKLNQSDDCLLIRENIHRDIFLEDVRCQE